MALDGRRNQAFRAIPDSELPAALAALHDLGLFADLDARGYRVGAKLNMGQRMYVRRMISEARIMFDYERDSSGFVRFSPKAEKNIALYTPTTETEADNARESLGLTLKAWKTFPVPTLGGYKGKPVKISTSAKKNEIGIAIEYPSWGLIHTIVPFDYRAIFKAKKGEKLDDESNPKDLIIGRFVEWAKTTLARFDHPENWFRLTTKFGDVSSTKYATSLGLTPLLEDMLPKILNKYSQFSVTSDGSPLFEQDAHILTGISVYRRTTKKEQPKQRMVYEYTRSADKKKRPKVSHKIRTNKYT